MEEIGSEGIWFIIRKSYGNNIEIEDQVWNLSKNFLRPWFSNLNSIILIPRVSQIKTFPNLSNLPNDVISNSIVLNIIIPR